MQTDTQLRREAERFIAKHGIGSLPGKRLDTGESADGGGYWPGGGGGREPGLPRQHRDHLSYSLFDSLDAWEEWMVDSGQEYTPLVGGAGGPATLDQLEKRARMAHVLSFLPEADVQLLYSLHVEGRTQSDVAAEEACTQQAISKRLARVEQDFRLMFGHHWNDDIDIDLSVEEA